MSPISKFTLLALASTVIAVPFAGHGHAAHGHLHKRQDAPAYGGDVSSAASEASPAATGEALPSYDAGSSVADSVPASSSAAAQSPPTYDVASSSEADAVPASSAPPYSSAPISTEAASASAPVSAPAYAVPSSSVADSVPASSSAVEYSYAPVDSSSEASANVPTAYASSEPAFTFAPVNSSSAAAVPTAYPSEAQSSSVKSSEAAATVPATYPAASSSEAAATVPVTSDTQTTTTVKTTRTTTVFTTLYLTSSASQPAATKTEAASVPAYSAPAASQNENSPAKNSAPAPSAEADQCAAVTITATEKVTEYVTITPGASSTEAAATGPKTVKITSTVYNNPGYHNSSAPVPTAYSTKASEAAPKPTSSEASISVPAYEVPSSSEADATVPATAPAYSAPASSEADATVPASSAPAYSAPVSSEEASISIPAYSAPAKTSEASANIPSAYAAVNKGVVDAEQGASSEAASTSVASKTASAPASYNTGVSSGGKRGLAYNDASLTTCFSGSNEVTWGYNWGSSRDGLSSNYKFIPTLWGTREDFTSVWDANVKECIADGAEYIFSFNEPDHNEQASMTPAAAATAYQTYMNPLKGQAKLCAPSVTNGGGDMGLTWLQSFLDSCGSDCEIDCLNVHWYDAASNSDYFKSHVQQAIDMAGGKPVFVSEFGATGSDAEVSAFLEEVMPWMDSNSNIAGYAYFMVKDGDLVTGGEPSAYGTTYKTYTS